MDDFFLGDYIDTYSGLRMYPLDPRPNMVCFEDIAHALSQQCRFAGHTSKFYSVAEHCVHVSRQVPEEFAQAALMHDAAEAYLMDIPRPLKQFLWYMPNALSMQHYKTYETALLRVITNRFKLKWPWDGLPVEVTVADCRMLSTEYMALVNENPPLSVQAFEPYVLSLGKWSPDQAKQAFWKRARELEIVTL